MHGSAGVAGLTCGLSTLGFTPRHDTQEMGWDGRDEEGRSVGSGMYFVRLAGRGTVETKKIVVAK